MQLTVSATSANYTDGSKCTTQVPCEVFLKTPKSAKGRRLMRWSGRRLSWWNPVSWFSDPPASEPPADPPAPQAQCAPDTCSGEKCPPGFTYTEDCAAWNDWTTWAYWKYDVTECVPDTVPAGAVKMDAELIQIGGCGFAFSANGEGKFGGDPSGCPEGYEEKKNADGQVIGVVKDATGKEGNCCQKPIWARRLSNEEKKGKRSLLFAQQQCLLSDGSPNPVTLPVRKGREGGA